MVVLFSLLSNENCYLESCHQIAELGLKSLQVSFADLFVASQ